MILQFFNFFTFVGTFLSGIIAIQMLRMYNSTFVNKLFLFYFTIDKVHGYLFGYFSMKLLERFGFSLIPNKYLVFIFSTNNDQSQNCAMFIGIWIIGTPTKSLFIAGLMMCR